MNEHKVGEVVLKDVKIQNESGKQEAVIDAARGIWGDTLSPQDKGAGQQNVKVKEALPNEVQDRSAKIPVNHEALHQQHHERNAPGDKAVDHKTHDARLVEASRQIKLLNNKLHEAGGPLHGSNLELVGFDKSGKLLMIDREQGKVAHKYLVDSHNGKVVRRTEDGDPNKWESGPKSQDGRLPKAHEVHMPKVHEVHTPKAHDLHAPRAHQEINPMGHELTTSIDTKSGARVSRDAHARVCAIEDGYGDKRIYNRDANGRVNEVSLTVNGKVEHYKPGNNVAGVTHAFWYKQPHNPADKTSGVQISIDDATNSLKISTKANEFIVYGADGSISQKAGSEPLKVTRPAYQSGLGAPDLERPMA